MPDSAKLYSMAWNTSPAPPSISRRDAAFTPRVRRVNKSKRPFRLFMLFVMVAAIGGGFTWFNKEAKLENPISPVHDYVVQAATTAPPETPLPSVVLDEITSASSPLAQQLATIESDVPGTYGVAVKNLKTGETYFENADDAFLMASTFKTPLVLTGLLQLEQGTLAEDYQINWLKVRDAMDLIIGRSEEDMAEILADKLTWPAVEKVARQFGMQHTSFTGDFTTTPRDQMVLYERIYKGTGMSRVVRDSMYNLLVRQQINDRLPKYLPSSAIVAHKTGEYDVVRHDVGIVTQDDTTYIVAIMGKDLSAPEDAREVEARMSLSIYKHMMKK